MGNHYGDSKSEQREVFDAGQREINLTKPKRKSPESVRRLSPKEVFQLATLVAAEYTSAGQTDKVFALYASEKLDIPGINENHVATSREIHGIPSLRFAKMDAEKTPHDEELYSRVLSLEKQVRKLFALADTVTPRTDPYAGKPAPSNDDISKFIVEYYGTKSAPAHLAFAKAILREFA